MESKKKTYVRAKVEFLANQPEIDMLLNSGYSGRFIYQKLLSEKKITMSLPRFYVLIRNGTRTTVGRKKSRPRVNSPAQPVTNDNFFHDTQKAVL
jgi:hypothetical protein